ASLGIKAGYTLDGMPTHSRAHTHSHSLTQYGQFRDANQPTMHVFGLGRKPECPEETPEAWGEHANSTHTAEVGIEPPTSINFFSNLSNSSSSVGLDHTG
ncbi:hypothetical protein QTP86_034659, partial [Hemibagrus guttatus]